MTAIVAIKKQYKALLGFLVPFLGLLTLVSLDTDVAAALPGVQVWLVTVGIPAITYAITWLKRNEPTIDEAQKALDRATARGI